MPLQWGGGEVYIYIQDHTNSTVEQFFGFARNRTQQLFDNGRMIREKERRGVFRCLLDRTREVLFSSNRVDVVRMQDIILAFRIGPARAIIADKGLVGRVSPGIVSGPRLLS